MDEVKKIKLDSLQSASSTSSSDILPIVQTNENNRRVTKKVSPDVLGSYVNTAKEYPTLQTTDKSIVGAINELSGGSGGASALEDLTDVSISSPTNGQVIKYNSTSNKWVNANDEGGGTAADISYDNTTSGLSSINVQGAVDELAATLNTLKGLGLDYTYINIQSAEYTSGDLPVE